MSHSNGSTSTRRSHQGQQRGRDHLLGACVAVLRGIVFGPVSGEPGFLYQVDIDVVAAHRMNDAFKFRASLAYANHLWGLAVIR